MSSMDYDEEDRILFSMSTQVPGNKNQDDDEINEDRQDWSKLRDLTNTYANNDSKNGDMSIRGKRKLNKSGLKNGTTGEKDFEPLNHELYDTKNLSDLRGIMFETLSMKRGLQSTREQINQNTIFYNSFLNKCYMLSPKGTFLKSMGRTDRFKRCWLEVEELLYLIERGACIVKDDMGVILSESDISNGQEYGGLELSLEHIYSSLIQTEDEYDNYTVYANLKRLGYIVIRSGGDYSQESDGSFSKNDLETRSLQSSFQLSLEDYSHIRLKISQNLSILLLNNFKNFLCQPLMPVLQYVKKFLTTHQILNSSIFDHRHFMETFYSSYTTIFDKLRLLVRTSSTDPGIPRSREQHLSSSLGDNASTSLYSSFTFDVWKPVPNFSKKNPPMPDFQVCVVNINKVRFPTLQDIKSLMCLSDHKQNRYKDDEVNGKAKFGSLKQGYRNCLIAVLDHGVINYISLKEMDFQEEGPVYKDPQLKSSKPQRQNRTKDIGKGSLPVKKTIAQELWGFLFA